MKVTYQNKEIEIDDDYIPGRDEFDYFDNIDLEDTIEIDVEKIKNAGESHE